MSTAAMDPEIVCAGSNQIEFFNLLLLFIKRLERILPPAVVFIFPSRCSECIIPVSRAPGSSILQPTL